MNSLSPRLSRIFTFLFGALALVWFSEMVLWAFRPFAEVWTKISNMIPPENPQLATALYITHAVRAAAKGTLGVMAVIGLRSKNPFARTALFASMALVPPLNIAFLFRAQGFPLRLTAVAAVFTVILWGSFFLFKESPQQAEPAGTTGSSQRQPSRWEIFRYVWFAVNSAALTLMACLFLFWPKTALDFIFPCLSNLLNTNRGGLSSLRVSNLASGTHLLALATVTWIATIYGRNNPTFQRAVAAASAVHAGLFCLFPLRQIILGFNRTCATSSILMAFFPLFVGWVLYVIVDTTRSLSHAGSRTRSPLQPGSFGG